MQISNEKKIDKGILENRISCKRCADCDLHIGDFVGGTRGWYRFLTLLKTKSFAETITENKENNVVFFPLLKFRLSKDALFLFFLFFSLIEI